MEQYLVALYVPSRSTTVVFLDLELLKYSNRGILRLFQPLDDAFGVPPGGPHDGFTDPGSVLTLHLHEDHDDPQASS